MANGDLQVPLPLLIDINSEYEKGGKVLGFLMGTTVALAVVLSAVLPLSLQILW